jgi:hypothetical protein
VAYVLERKSLTPGADRSRQESGASRKYYDTVVGMLFEGKWIFDGQRLVADEVCKQIDALLRTLTPCGSSDDGWTKLYRDTEGGTFWELTYPYGEMHGGGPPRLESLSSEEMRLRHSDVNVDNR